MSIYGKCPVCAEYGFLSSHKCPPVWEIVRIDYGSDPTDAEIEDLYGIQTAYGKTKEATVEQYCYDRFGHWDYPREIEVWIRKDATQEWAKYEVEVQTMPVFQATRKETYERHTL